MPSNFFDFANIDTSMWGSIAAVFCAFTWSFSVILFKKSGEGLHPILLNLLKNTLAFALMVPTVWLVEGTLTPDVSTRDLAILCASGLLGIGIADALVLKSLGMVGATRIAIVECAYSPSVIALSLLFLAEELTIARALGTALVLIAILCVSLKRVTAAGETSIPAGMLIGLLGICSMAAGIVMIKPLFNHIPLFWLICVRLGAGSLGSFVLFHLLCNRPREMQLLRASPNKLMIFGACLLSTYVSMIFWVSGYKYNDAIVTAVLNQTSTIFTVVLAAIFLKERFTPMKALGTALAVGGVLLMTFG